MKGESCNARSPLVSSVLSLTVNNNNNVIIRSMRASNGAVLCIIHRIILRIILYYVLSYPASSRTVDVIATSQYSDQ